MVQMMDGLDNDSMSNVGDLLSYQIHNQIKKENLDPKLGNP
jgi:hypothetical protein